jgi:hypothetical protein
VIVLPYDDHYRALKLLHSLDRTVWSAKVEVIMKSDNYETLTVDELFSDLKSSEVDHGVRGMIESPTDPHRLSLLRPAPPRLRSGWRRPPSPLPRPGSGGIEVPSAC